MGNTAAFHGAFGLLQGTERIKSVENISRHALHTEKYICIDVNMCYACPAKGLQRAAKHDRRLGRALI